MKLAPGVHSPQKVHAPFEQRVLNRTLNAGIFNPKRVVTFTPFFAFSHANFFRMGRFTDIGCTKRVNISEKRRFWGNFWEVIGKRTLDAGRGDS